MILKWFYNAWLHTHDWPGHTSLHHANMWQLNISLQTLDNGTCLPCQHGAIRTCPPCKPGAKGNVHFANMGQREMSTLSIYHNLVIHFAIGVNPCDTTSAVTPQS